MKSKPYSKYNYTTIDVIEKIPLSWSIHKLKYLKSDEKYSIVDGPFGTQLHNDEYVDEGVPVVRVTNLDFNGNFHSENLVFITEEKYNSLKRSSIKENDLIIAKTGATIGKTGLFVGFDKGIVSSSCFKLAIKKHINLNLIKYLLISNVGQKQILILSSGATRDSMNIEEFSNIVFPIPNNTDEQNQIVNFLDKKVNIIDNTIEKDKELIELLKEKRNALINQVVTKGLNPNVSMKDSGIEWFGEIPVNWEIHKMKNITFFQEGPGLRNWQFVDEGIKVICVTNITEKGIDFSNYVKYISIEEYNQIYKHFTVDKGDLLLSSSGNSWGKIAEFNSEETVILNTSTIRIHENVNHKINNDFLKWALQSEGIREQLSLLMTGSCQPNFGPSHLSKVKLICPPIKEQIIISNFLDKKISNIEKIIDKTETKIGLLEEYKASLIYNVVTGKVDVRGVEV